MNTQQHDLSSAFHPSFTGGRQEKKWILKSLGPFYVDEWFTDVLYRVRGGKEATVYCCRAHPATGRDLIAAKVYRPRMFRAMKNDALYKTGRLIRSAEGNYPDSRTARALKKRSVYGRHLDATSWCQHEVSTLDALWTAGVRVPQVLASSGNVILMDFIGDEVRGAPLLQDIDLPREEAERLFATLRQHIEAMLSVFVIHADLSPYNLLLWRNDLYVIDVPQAVDTMRHPQAYSLFARDVERVAAYFQRQGVEIDAASLALEMWQQAYG